MANELYLYGTVGGSFWEEDHFTAATVRAALAGMSGDITVHLNSGGGVATEGQAIYTMLVDYPGRVTVIIDGVAASAASLIAMAGDEIVMRLGAWMLIHDPATPYTMGRGTEDDHRKEAELLAVVSGAYADIYAQRAGISRDEARAIMRDETVMDGPEAVRRGFADTTDSEAAIAAAMFDYRIYPHAPQSLRAGAERLGTVPGKEAVMAMIAGTSRTNPKEPSMAVNHPVAAVEATPPTKPITNAAPAAADPVITAADPLAAVAAERDRVKRITQSVRMAGLQVSVSDDLIDRGVPLAAALDEINAAWVAAGDGQSALAGAPTARILRDERDTRRDGMAEAIHAQISGAQTVAGPGRDFMAMSLVEMAAATISHRGPMRQSGQREQILRMAFHTSSDFPIVLENALNKRLMEQYAMAAPTYRDVAMQMDFTDFRPHPISQISDFPLLQEVAAGGEIKFGTLAEKKELVALKALARGLSIERQALINDDLGAIDRAVRGTAMAVAASEDQVFWAMALGGASADGPTLLETTRQLCNTTDGTKAGTAAAINTDTLGLGRAAIRKRKRLDGSDLEAVASILLVGPDKQTQAEQNVSLITPAQPANVNPFTGRLSVVTTAKITGNAWYLLTAPSVLPVFMFGFLQGDAGPRVRMEEPFGVQGVRWTVERDFGCGVVDWRGIYKNAGA